ncbi:MAG: zinc metallopeptidase [Bacilli bacterium]
MIWFMEDFRTLALMILSLIITLVAQGFVSSTYSKYKKIKSKSGLSGSEAARKVLDKHGLKDVYVVETKGMLSDHYDPRRKVVRLSSDIFHKESIASIAVAVHEVGHAIQDKEGYGFMRIRAAILPVVNIGSKLGYFAIFIGFFAGLLDLVWVGIVMLLGTLLFQLVTLPVEINASKRAKEELAIFIDSGEQKMVKNMLFAAAMTYVAALATTLLQILRLVLMAQRRR